MRAIATTLAILILCFNPCLAEEFRDIGFVEIEEVSTEPGLVSTAGKQFRLIVHHDPEFIPAEDIETFDENTSPLLRGLDIIKRNINRKDKNPKEIRNDFEFSLEANSTESDTYSGFLVTKYLSDTQVFKNASRFNFKFEMFYYLDDKDVDTRNLRTKFNKKYDIKALEFEFNNMQLSADTVTFSAKKPDKKMSKIISDDYTIQATVETSINLSTSIKNLTFKSESPIGKKIASRIKKNGARSKKSHRLIPSVDQDGISIINTSANFYQIDIPISFQSKNKLTKAELAKLENLDLLVTPIFLDIKTGDSRDMKLSGILREEVGVIFNESTTTIETE